MQEHKKLAFGIFLILFTFFFIKTSNAVNTISDVTDWISYTNDLIGVSNSVNCPMPSCDHLYSGQSTAFMSRYFGNFYKFKVGGNFTKLTYGSMMLSTPMTIHTIDFYFANGTMVQLIGDNRVIELSNTIGYNSTCFNSSTITISGYAPKEVVAIRLVLIFARFNNADCTSYDSSNSNYLNFTWYSSYYSDRHTLQDNFTFANGFVNENYPLIYYNYSVNELDDTVNYNVYSFLPINETNYDYWSINKNGTNYLENYLLTYSQNYSGLLTVSPYVEQGIVPNNLDIVTVYHPLSILWYGSVYPNCTSIFNNSLTTGGITNGTYTGFWSQSAYCQSPKITFGNAFSFNCTPIEIPSDCTNILVYHNGNIRVDPYQVQGLIDQKFSYEIFLDNHTYNYTGMFDCGLGGSNTADAVYPNDYVAGGIINTTVYGFAPTNCTWYSINGYIMTSNTTLTCMRSYTCQAQTDLCWDQGISGWYSYDIGTNCVQSNFVSCGALNCINGTGCTSETPPPNATEIFSFDAIKTNLIPTGVNGTILFMIIGLAFMGITTYKIEQANKSGNGWIIGLLIFFGVIIIGNLFGAVPIWITIAIVIIAILYFSRGLWYKTGGT